MTGLTGRSLTYRLIGLSLLLVLFTRFVTGAGDRAETSEPKNTQSEDLPFLKPADALASIKAPAGFKVTLFAHEPEVQQPIAMAFDPRGRMWVAENYTYAESAVNHDLTQNDRILVLQDEDNDGLAEKRKVFLDGLKRLTSVEVGFGGVWALTPPNLLFIPDRNGDDVPDGEPEIVLDGWDAGASRHNFVNGLRWGPDGWLYGRNGILSNSRVGKPGTPRDERTALSCAIWRFHPVTRQFEVVSQGTTNSWGHDWDEHGQLFFINTVIGHLWHSIPGAHFRRMFGEDLNPYIYESIEQTADHVHWDVANEDWTALRTKPATAATDSAGGGHAHSGLMIYQGENWPEKYRGQLFTLNFHGRRINQDALVREGATYVGKHRPDLLTVGDPYFRGIDLTYGPDGGVYVLDWSDIGECHENDGVHRTSGRIYKATWTGPGAKTAPQHEGIDLAALKTEELATKATQGSEWVARQSRRLLQERAADKQPMDGARDVLFAAFDQEGAPAKHALRAMWTLHSIGAPNEGWLVEQLSHQNEHVRLWAVQLLVESRSPSPIAIKALHELAATEQSGLVLTYLAASMQRMPDEAGFPIAAAIVQHGEFADDRVLPLMVWYGLESAVPGNPDAAVKLVAQSKMPALTKNLARRITTEIESNPGPVQALIGQISSTRESEQRVAILQGMSAALNGWLKAPQPSGWEAVAKQLEVEGDASVKELVQELSVVFGSGRAADNLKAVALDKKQPPAVRRRAIKSLAEARLASNTELFHSLITDNDVADEAVRGLGLTGDANLPEALLQQYSKLSQSAKSAVIDVLAARPASANRLLDAVESGAISADDLQAFQLRQIQLSADKSVQARIEKLWPSLRLIEGNRLQQIADLREQLTVEALATGDLSKGQKLYEQSCAKCHKLFGRGESVGPELTGAQRSNLNYLLENIVDPSAAVATNFRMSLILLDDGRVLNGVVVQQTERTLALQTPTERLILDRRSVEEVKPSQLSLMPNGLVDQLSDDQVRDLFSYLMTPADPGALKSETSPGK
jgi:putative membrane-bound dehydrogenase-like protein